MLLISAATELLEPSSAVPEAFGTWVHRSSCCPAGPRPMCALLSSGSREMKNGNREKSNTTETD